MTFKNKTHKLIKTEDGKPCGVISFHQHGDIIAIGASKVQPKFINSDKFKFREGKGKSLADKRAKKVFEDFLHSRENEDPSMLIVNLSKDRSFNHLSEIIEKAKTCDIEDEETNRKQLALYF